MWLQPVPVIGVIQSLALLCKDYQKSGPTIPFPMSMKELARLAATTRETVNQVLKEAPRRGENRVQA